MNLIRKKPKADAVCKPFLTQNSASIKKESTLLEMIDCVTEVVLPLNAVSDLGKLFLTRLILKGGTTSESNEELAIAMRKSRVSISRVISELIDLNLIASEGLTTKRALAIVVSDESMLYNYHYSIYNINNNKNNYNRLITDSITVEKLRGSVLVISQSYYFYDPDEIQKQLMMIPLEKWNDQLQREPVGKVIRDFINKLIVGNQIPLDIQPDPETFKERLLQRLIDLFNDLVNEKMFSYSKTDFTSEPDEKAIRREKQEKNLKEYIEKAWDDKLLIVQSNDELQDCNAKALVKIKGEVHEIWPGGEPQMLNLKLMLEDGLAHVVIRNSEYSLKRSFYNNLKGKNIEFRGLVFYNRGFSSNSVLNCSGHECIKIIGDEGFLQANLSYHDNDEAPF